MTSAPIAGNSTRGCPKVIAMMSSTNVIVMLRDRRRNFAPSMSEPSPGRSASWSAAIRGSVNTPRTANVNSTTSIV